MNATGAITPADRWADAIVARPDRLRRDWDFSPSTPSVRTRLLRLAAGRRASPFPTWRVLRPVTPAARWNCLFLFCPQGSLDVVQQRLVEVVRALCGRLLVVAALPDGAEAPASLAVADALVTKAPDGFDFSAYRIALAQIAEHSPGARAYVQNDSVFGPLGAIDAMVEDAAWDLTGFVANPAVERHISSFAFVARSVTPEWLAAVTPAMPGDRCYHWFTDVVAMQETRLARAAARGGSVGSCWYLDDSPPEPTLVDAVVRRTGLSSPRPALLDLRGDATLGMPLELVRQGFPFVKRSLFGKFAGSPAMPDLAALLHAHGWPVAWPGA